MSTFHGFFLSVSLLILFYSSCLFFICLLIFLREREKQGIDLEGWGESGRCKRRTVINLYCMKITSFPINKIKSVHP